MHYGYRIVEDMLDGLNNYLDGKGFASVNDIIGRSVGRVTDWSNLDLNYDVKAHVNEEHCIRCNLCYVACEDGAHQSFEFVESDGKRYPRFVFTRVSGEWKIVLSDALGVTFDEAAYKRLRARTEALGRTADALEKNDLHG